MQIIKWNIRAHIEQVSTKTDIIYFPNIIGNGLTIHDTLRRNLHSTTRSFGDKKLYIPFRVSCISLGLYAGCSKINYWNKRNRSVSFCTLLVIGVYLFSKLYEVSVVIDVAYMLLKYRLDASETLRLREMATRRHFQMHFLK